MELEKSEKAGKNGSVAKCEKSCKEGERGGGAARLWRRGRGGEQRGGTEREMEGRGGTAGKKADGEKRKGGNDSLIEINRTITPPTSPELKCTEPSLPLPPRSLLN